MFRAPGLNAFWHVTVFPSYGPNPEVRAQNLADKSRMVVCGFVKNFLAS